MIHTLLVTIAASNTAQQLQTTHQTAAWVTLQAGSGNAAAIYHGASNVTSSNGQEMASGGGGGSPQYPPAGDGSIYALEGIYVYGTINDTMRVLYATR